MGEVVLPSWVRRGPLALANGRGDDEGYYKLVLTCKTFVFFFRNGSLLDANGLARIQEDDVLIDGFEQPEVSVRGRGRGRTEVKGEGK